MLATAGVSFVHDLIATRLHMLVGQHVRDKKCRWHTSDMRVLLAPGGAYAYPDLSATCGEPHYADQHADIPTNPSLVVEILSSSTEVFDRGKKPGSIAACRPYGRLLPIAQDRYEVELFRRQPDGQWTVLDAAGLDASVELTTIGYTLSLRELYETTGA